ncbi:MAG: HAD-IA family hydrolase [Magnetococcales bacterium]|nr:HAD-IA family hydrolase [Magnetococcales bacterium]
MKSQFKLIIFDCDGTLVDSLDGIVTSAQLALDDMGYNRTLAHSEVAQVVGLSLLQAFQKILPNASPSEVERGVALYKTHYKRLADGGEFTSPLYPGVIDTLKQLHSSGLVLAIATGKSLKGLQRNLNELKFGEFFSCLKTADHAPSKPNPEMLLQILNETGFFPHDALMVGDTDFDINMGRAAGMKTCAVTFGCHGKEQLALSRPDYWLDNMADLPGLIGLPRLD